jgi:hypothetical protein
MFGHQDHDDESSNQQNSDAGVPQNPAITTAAPPDAPQPSYQPTPDSSPAPEAAETSAGSSDASQQSDSQADSGEDYIMTDAPSPVPANQPAAPMPVSASLPPTAAQPAQTDVALSNVSGDGGDAGELLNLKQTALQQLSPLLGHLDQTPEEKFRTIMMLIQASDNQALLQSAYDAAQAITDEKVRAQALLDVVNEINYFTTQAAADTPQTT